MTVGIAEVETFASELPTDTAFNFHAATSELFFPSHEFSALDRKGEMNFSGAAVRRYGAAGKDKRLRILFAAKQQKDLVAAGGVGAKAGVAGDHPQTE